MVCYKVTKNDSDSQLLAKFIQTQNKYPTSLGEVSILT